MNKLTLGLVLALGVANVSANGEVKNLTNRIQATAAEKATVKAWIKSHKKTVALLGTAVLVAVTGATSYVLMNKPATLAIGEEGPLPKFDESQNNIFNKIWAPYAATGKYAKEYGYTKPAAIAKEHPKKTIASASAAIVVLAALYDLAIADKSQLKALIAKLNKEEKKAVQGTN